MVIDVAIAKHTPRPPRHLPEERVVWPAPSRCANRKLVEVRLEAMHLGVPCIRFARKQLARRGRVSRKGDYARNEEVKRRDA